MGTDFKEWAALASVRTPFVLNRVVRRASNVGANHARAAAPVYDKPRWRPTRWRFYSHHKRVPGGLKRGTKPMKSRITVQISQTKHSGGFRSGSRYAAYVNNGFFHTKAKRPIEGRHYMAVGEIHAELYLNTAIPRAIAEIIKPS